MDSVIDVTGLGEMFIGDMVEAVRMEAERMLAAVGRLRLVANDGVAGDRLILERLTEEVDGWFERCDVFLEGFWAAVAAAEAGGEAVTAEAAAVLAVSEMGTEVWWMTCRSVIQERHAVAAGGLAAGARVVAARDAARDAERAERWARLEEERAGETVTVAEWRARLVEERILEVPSPLHDGVGGMRMVAAGGGGMGVVAAGEEVEGGGKWGLAVDWWRPKAHGPRCLVVGPLSLTGAVPLSPVFPEASFLV